MWIRPFEEGPRRDHDTAPAAPGSARHADNAGHTAILDDQVLDPVLDEG